MSFYWGTDIGDLIFKGATVDSTAGLVCACFIFAVISFVYESLQFLMLESKLFNEDESNVRRSSSDRNTLLSPNSLETEEENRHRSASSIYSNLQSYMMKIRRVLLYTTNSTVNYFIMFAIMVYNSYLFISILIGTVAAYFLFGHRKFYRNIKIIDQRRKLISASAADCAEDEDHSVPTTEQDRDSPERCHYTCRVEINSSDEDKILNETREVDEKGQGPSCCLPQESADKNEQIT